MRPLAFAERLFVWYNDAERGYATYIGHGFVQMDEPLPDDFPRIVPFSQENAVGFQVVPVKTINYQPEGTFDALTLQLGTSFYRSHLAPLLPPSEMPTTATHQLQRSKPMSATATASTPVTTSETSYKKRPILVFSREGDRFPFQFGPGKAQKLIDYAKANGGADGLLRALEGFVTKHATAGTNED